MKLPFPSRIPHTDLRGIAHRGICSTWQSRNTQCRGVPSESAAHRSTCCGFHNFKKRCTHNDIRIGVSSWAHGSFDLEVYLIRRSVCNLCPLTKSMCFFVRSLQIKPFSNVLRHASVQGCNHAPMHSKLFDVFPIFLIHDTDL